MAPEPSSSVELQPSRARASTAPYQISICGAPPRAILFAESEDLSANSVLAWLDPGTGGSVASAAGPSRDAGAADDARVVQRAEKEFGGGGKRAYWDVWLPPLERFRQAFGLGVSREQIGHDAVYAMAGAGLVGLGVVLRWEDGGRDMIVPRRMATPPILPADAFKP
jgi:hypothetical protein